MVNASKPSVRPRMRPSHGCSGITNHACTRRSTTSARTSSNSSGNNAKQHLPVDVRKQKQAMEKQESKQRFPTFPQPRRLRTINTYGIRVLRARSGFISRQPLADTCAGPLGSLHSTDFYCQFRYQHAALRSFISYMLSLARALLSNKATKAREWV